MESTEHKSEEKQEYLIVGGIIFLGLLLRVVAGIYAGMYVDEAYAYYLSFNDFKTIYETALVFDANPPLYYFLLRLISFISSNEFVFKLPSILFSSASIYFLYRAARLISDRRTSIVTILLYAVAFNSWVVHSQIKMYGVAALPVCVSWYVLLGLIIRPGEFYRKKYLIPFFLANLLMPYLHYTLVLSVFATFICVLLFVNREYKWKTVSVFVVFGLLFTAWFLGGKLISSNDAVKFSSEDQRSRFSGLFINLTEFSVYATRFDLPIHWSFARKKMQILVPSKDDYPKIYTKKELIFFNRKILPVIGIVISLIGFGGYLLLRKKERKGADAVFLSFMIPFGGMLAVSLIGFNMNYQLRYNQFLLPLFYFFLSYFLCSFSSRAARGVSYVFIGYLVFIGLFTGFAEYPRDSYFWYQDWRRPAAFIREHQQPGDAIVMYVDFSMYPLNREYMGDEISWKFDINVPLYCVPVFSKDIFSKGYLEQFIIKHPTDFNSRYANRRVFLVLSQDGVYDPRGIVRQHFLKNYQIEDYLLVRSILTIGWIEVYLMTPRTGEESINSGSFDSK